MVTLTATLALTGCVAVDKSDEGGDVRTAPSAQGSQTATPAPSETPSATETEPAAAGPAIDAALSAAGAIYGVTTATECSGDEDCIQPLPEAAASAEYGVASLAYITAGGGGAVVVMGRDANETWQLWVATQGDAPQVIALPGELLICGDAESLALRSGPGDDSEAAGQIARQQVVDASEFVLTAPGTEDAPGEGWYQVSGQADGWIAASNVVAASIGDCSAGSGDGGSGPVG